MMDDLLILRPGPSASQVQSPVHIPDGMDSNSVAEIVKAISLLQVVMKEPWAQSLLQQNLSIPPVSGSECSELRDAETGKPAPSAPKKVEPAVKSMSPAVPETKEEPAPPAKTPAIVPSVPASPAVPVVPVVNSSTHRAAHARLVRKMASLGETEAPNMTRLFNGTRKDWCLTKKCFFKSNISKWISLNYTSLL